MISNAKVCIQEDMWDIQHDSETSHSINASFGLQFKGYFVVWMWWMSPAGYIGHFKSILSMDYH